MESGEAGCDGEGDESPPRQGPDRHEIALAHLVEYGTKSDSEGGLRHVKIDGEWKTLGKDTPTPEVARWRRRRNISVGTCRAASVSPTNNPTPAGCRVGGGCVVDAVAALRHRTQIDRSAAVHPGPGDYRRRGESAGSYVVSVRTFVVESRCFRRSSNAAAETHARMLLWSRTLDPVTINGRLVSPDFVKVFQTPTWVDYDDHQILCKLGRYDIGLTFTT